MTLRERLQDDTTAAMRSGDALRRDVLRMVQNAIYNIEKAKHIDHVRRRDRRRDHARGEDPPRERRGLPQGRPRGPRGEGGGGDRDPRRLPPRGPDRRRAAAPSSTRASPRPAPPPPATWARSWAGSPRGSAAGPTARSPPASSPRRWRVLTWPRTIRGTDPPSRRSTTMLAAVRRAHDAVHPPRRRAPDRGVRRCSSWRCR